MEQKNYNVIGVMSGTSLDGVDCAVVNITMIAPLLQEDIPSFKAIIGVAKTIPYPKHWVDSLSRAHTLPKEKLADLNVTYTAYLAKVINEFIRHNNLIDIDAVCSHGHTVLHQPDKGFTLQIGNLPSLSALIGQQVVCDFRVQDVEMGGQGAPLVPIGDQLLYSVYDFCLNLGGFANVSTDIEGVRIAYDICPVNVVLNRYAQQLGVAYDDGGAFAKAGNVNSELLETLNKLPFYSMKAPKSLGIEWVHTYVFPLLEAAELSPIDILSTCTEHIAMQLADQFAEGSTILVTGGGAYNTFLLERVRFFKELNIVIPEPTLVEFKEALIFALLGVLKLEGLPNCLASVTGARENHSSGVLYKF